MVTAEERVLIIDDEIGPRESLRMILKDRYGTRTASSALEGLQMLEQDDFGIVILDIRMPGMSGIDALRKIKKRFPDVEVVMVTAYASIETAREAMSLGAMDYLIKPFDVNAVLSVVEKGLSRRKVAKEHLREHERLQVLVDEKIKELRITEQMRKDLFESATDGILICAMDGTIIDINKRAGEMYDFSSKDEALGVNIRRLHESDVDLPWKDKIEDILRGTPSIVEVGRRSKTGKWLFLEISSKAIDLGPVTLIQSFLRDVTEKKMLEAQLIRSQKMESIGTLAGGIAHDFSNILSSIGGFAEMLREQEELSQEAQRRIDIILKSVSMGTDLIAKLLSFSREQEIEIKPVDLNQAVEETLSLLGGLALRHIDIRKSLDPALPPTEGDAAQLRQVIMNLLINAGDALKDRGGPTVTVTTSVRVIPQSEASLPPFFKPGKYVALVVTDNGCGIPAEHMPRIFEPFYTTKEKGRGTGLGLAMAYGIMKSHKGYILVDSSVGQGTKFSVYLPVSVTPRPDKN